MNIHPPINVLATALTRESNELYRNYAGHIYLILMSDVGTVQGRRLRWLISVQLTLLVNKIGCTVV